MFEKRCFFVLHGQNESIARAEVLAILEAENMQFSDIEELCQVLLLDVSDFDVLQIVGLRASMSHYCCRHISTYPCDSGLILSMMRDVDFNRFVNGESFAVRVKKIKSNLSPEGKRMSVEGLEREIGAIIKKNTGLQVRLRNPETLFLGVISENVFVFGTVKAKVSKKGFLERRGRFMPFFHPGIMKPQISRLMVNLARAKRNTELLLFDPFCGTGGMLIEGEVIGCNTLGSDIDKAMVFGCKKNLECLGLVPRLIKADARKLPIKSEKIGAVATDPPHSRSSSTKGEKLEVLLEKFFTEIARVLRKDGYLSISVPDTIPLERIGEKSGLKLQELHKMYVHKSLTRLIGVFQK